MLNYLQLPKECAGIATCILLRRPGRPGLHRLTGGGRRLRGVRGRGAEPAPLGSFLLLLVQLQRKRVVCVRLLCCAHRLCTAQLHYHQHCSAAVTHTNLALQLAKEKAQGEVQALALLVGPVKVF
jgi:hypothetical protein